MTALTANRTTRFHASVALGRVDTFDVEAGVKIYQGAFLVLNTAGRVQPATTATGLVAVGRA